MKSETIFSVWPKRDGNDTRSVLGHRGAPPPFFSVKSALIHHWPQASGDTPPSSGACAPRGSPTGASSGGADNAAYPQGT